MRLTNDNDHLQWFTQGGNSLYLSAHLHNLVKMNTLFEENIFSAYPQKRLMHGSLGIGTDVKQHEQSGIAHKEDYREYGSNANGP